MLESDGEQSSDEHDDQGQGEFAQREPVLDRIRRNREEAQRRMLDEQGQDGQAQREPMRPQGVDTGAETRPDGRNDPSAAYARNYANAIDPDQTPVIESSPTTVVDMLEEMCPYLQQIDAACDRLDMARPFF